MASMNNAPETFKLVPDSPWNQNTPLSRAEVHLVGIVTGYLHAHPRATAAQIASALGTTELEADTCLTKLCIAGIVARAA